MPNDKRKLTIGVSFLVGPELDDKLQEMVRAYSGSKSALLRQLVESAYKMRVDARPVCANSEGCRAPHLFMSFGIPERPGATDRPDPDTNRHLAGHDGG